MAKIFEHQFTQKWIIHIWKCAQTMYCSEKYDKNIEYDFYSIIFSKTIKQSIISSVFKTIGNMILHIL